MRRISTLFGILLLAPLAIGQHTGHDHDLLSKFDQAPAQYAMTARVDAAQGRVSVWADLAFTNRSDQDLQSILFDIPNRSHFVLDSILLFGSPLDTSRIRIDQASMTLAVPVKAGEMVPLQLSFATELVGLKELTKREGAILADDWYPRISTQNSNEKKSIPEVADFRLEIAVDTPLHLAASGTWVNEVERIGSIPDRADSIFEDLLNQTTGQVQAKRYFFRLTGAERMSFAVLRNPSMARIQFDQQRFDLYGTESKVSRGREDFLEEASKIAREVVRRMGALPDGRFAALFGREGHSDHAPDRFGYVSYSSRDPERMLTEFTFALASQYFNRAGEMSSELPWSQGAAVYLTAAILHHLYQDTGYKMVYEWLEERLPPRDIRRPLGNKPFAWMETMRRPNRPFSPEDSIRFREQFVAPSALQILAAGISDDAVVSLLRRYSLDVRHRHAKPNEFDELISKELGERWVARIDQFQRHRQTYDWRIQAASFDKTDDGYAVRVDIDASALEDMPVELALINGSDTVMAQYSPQGDSGATGTFLQEIPFRPSTIVLDPLHKLPDNNRQNNVYISGKTGGRYQSNRSEFPTFKRLTRGD